MTNQERGRRGGNTLADRVSPAYYSFIGRRGGRKYMFNFYSRLAREYDLRTSVEYGPFFQDWTTAQIDRWNQQRRDEFAESAEKYRLEDSGSKMMMALWTRDNCQDPPKRKPANTWEARLRRWERNNKAA